MRSRTELAHMRGRHFYKVLNKPELIGVHEKMGHLDREDAGFLHAAATSTGSAATFPDTLATF